MFSLDQRPLLGFQLAAQDDGALCDANRAGLGEDWEICLCILTVKCL